MSRGTKNRSSRTGELEMIEGEPRLDRERTRPTSVPEIEIPKEIGSTTGIMRILKEADDETSQGDEDTPAD